MYIVTNHFYNKRENLRKSWIPRDRMKEKQNDRKTIINVGICEHY